MFEKAGEPLSANTGGTGTLRSRGVEQSLRLKKQLTLTGNLRKMVDYENLKKACKKLSANTLKVQAEP
jgi:hypothetical protein